MLEQRSSFAFRAGCGDMTVAGMQSEFSKYVSRRIGIATNREKKSCRALHVAPFKTLFLRA
jgi:hypothetical protein